MSKFLKKYGVFILSTFLLVFPALFSKFPLVYSDSGTYINSSVSFIPPVDRPLGYGIFINIFSWVYTLWPVVLAQSAMGVFLIWKFTKLLLKGKSEKQQKVAFFSTVILLAIGSSVVWYASQLMPDVFIAYGVMAVLLYFIDHEAKRWDHVGYLIVILVCFITHFSHLLILALTIGIIFWVRNWRWKDQLGEAKRFFKRVAMVLVLGIFSVLFMSVMNYREFNKFAPSMATYIFMTGRLAESGILEKYLEKQCEMQSERCCNLCGNYEDIKSTNDLIWSDGGILSQHGWNWIEANECSKSLFWEVMGNPEYFMYFVLDCGRNTMVQLFQVNIGGGLGAYRVDSSPHTAVDKHFWAERNYYLDTAQSYDLLKLDFFRVLNYFFIVGTIFLMVVFSIYGKFSAQEKFILAFLLIAYFFNAFVTASLANVYDRLQARMTWPFVLFAALVMIRIGLEFYAKNRIVLQRREPENQNRSN